MSGTCVNLAPRPTARCCRWRMTPKPSPVYSESFTMSIFRLLLLLFLILLLKPYNRVHIGAYNRFPEMLLTNMYVTNKYRYVVLVKAKLQTNNGYRHIYEQKQYFTGCRPAAIFMISCRCASFVKFVQWWKWRCVYVTDVVVIMTQAIFNSTTRVRSSTRRCSTTQSGRLLWLVPDGHASAGRSLYKLSRGSASSSLYAGQVRLQVKSWDAVTVAVAATVASWLDALADKWCQAQMCSKFRNKRILKCAKNRTNQCEQSRWSPVLGHHVYAQSHS